MQADVFRHVRSSSVHEADKAGSPFLLSSRSFLFPLDGAEDDPGVPRLNSERRCGT